MTHPLEPQLAAMRAALRDLQEGRADVGALCAAWRARGVVMDALPARYRQVADDLLARLEAGCLFTEESCSFSQQDLTDNLDTWLDKASQTLAQA